MLVVEQVVEEAGYTGRLEVIQTQTLTGLNIIHYIIISSLILQLGLLMRENIIYRDEARDRIMFPGLAASSHGLTRMLS